MQPFVEAYLDIETTGLSSTYDEITVIGIHLCNGADTQFIQLVGDEITAISLVEALQEVDIIYTYIGKAFDLPFIHTHLGINLAEMFAHHDLMYDCWNRNLYGGFKAVERQLGIERKLTEVNGYEAVRLWWRYSLRNGLNENQICVYCVSVSKINPALNHTNLFIPPAL